MTRKGSTGPESEALTGDGVVRELLEVVDELDAENTALRDKIVILTRLAEDAICDHAQAERSLQSVQRQFDDAQAAIANSRTVRATAPFRRLGGRATALLGRERDRSMPSAGRRSIAQSDGVDPDRGQLRRSVLGALR